MLNKFSNCFSPPLLCDPKPHCCTTKKIKYDRNKKHFIFLASHTILHFMVTKHLGSSYKLSFFPFLLTCDLEKQKYAPTVFSPLPTFSSPLLPPAPNPFSCLSSSSSSRTLPKIFSLYVRRGKPLRLWDLPRQMRRSCCNPMRPSVLLAVPGKVVSEGT